MKRRTIDINGTFDIETEDWDKYVVGGLYTPDQGFESFTHEREDELATKILEFSGCLWAHNGGKYDTLWVLDRFLSRHTDEAKVYLAGQRIVCLQVRDVEIRDSAALIPIRLEKAAGIGGGAKASTGLDCSHPRCIESIRIGGKGCGGYCSIRRDMAPDELSRLIGYLEVDCTTVYGMLTALQKYGEENDLDLCSTIGASSWRTARRWAGLSPAKWAAPGIGRTKLYHFAARAYFGGRTQVFRPYSERGYHCDVNSAYVNALRTLSLPVGRRTLLSGRKAQTAYDNGKPGIYKGLVRVPDTFIPPLPYRGRNRIYYPTGDVPGVWTRLELDYALSTGCTLLGISRSLCWDEEQNLFASFCESVWRLRDGAGKKSPMGEWLKFFGNSLTGKLAQNPLVEEVVLNPTKVNFCPANAECYGRFCPSQGGEECCPHGCSGMCGRMTPLDKRQKIWSAHKWIMPSSGHVHWAAYLTAFQRTYLYRKLIEGGEKDAVYCDTDSCFSENARYDRMGASLGDWLDEGEYERFHSLAPKTYEYYESIGDKFSGPLRRECRAKGMQDPAENWEIIETYGEVSQDRGVKSLKSAIAHKNEESPGEERSFFSRKQIVRRVKPPEVCPCGKIHVGDRLLQGDLTLPQTIDSVLAHERGAEIPSEIVEDGAEG